MTKFKSMPFNAILFGIAFTLSGTSAFAQKKSNVEGPCADEARKFCKDALGDKEATLECHKKLSKRDISDICGNFLSQYGQPRNGTSRSRIKSKRPVGDDAKQNNARKNRRTSRAKKDHNINTRPNSKGGKIGSKDKVKVIHPSYKEGKTGGKDKVKVIHPSYMDKSSKERRTRRAKSAAKTRAPVTPPKRKTKCNRSKTCVKTNDCCPNPPKK